MNDPRDGMGQDPRARRLDALDRIFPIINPKLAKLAKEEGDREQSEYDKRARDSERIAPLLKELERVWRKHPDLRLAQLVMNLVGQDKPSLFEDDKLMEVLAEW